MVNSKYLFFLRIELTPDKVTQPEGDEVRRGRPVVDLSQLALIVEVTGHFAQAMNKPIQVCNSVAVKVLHYSG